MSIFGFSTQSSSGSEFLPIVKYDARAGLWFRIDRVDTGQGFVPEPVDITRGFKAIFDLENLQTGWISFPSGSAPLSSFVMMKDLRAQSMGLPPRPGENFNNGLRFMIKLARDIGGDKPIREVMTTAGSFMNGIEALYLEYEKEAAANAGKLPVVVMDGITLIKSGSGNRTSSNYRPNLKIVGWVPRGDLEWKPRANIETPAVQAGNGAAPASRPATGATRAAPPAQAASFDASDFG